MRSLAGIIAVLCLVTAADARPRTEYKLRHVDPASLANIVNSKLIFLNRCPGGCKVTDGDPDSRTDKSDIGHGMLSAFSEGDQTWGQVVSCMKSTFARFNVEITDKDPGPYVDHFEIMIAGDPGQIGLPGEVGGIADLVCENIGACASYLPNALVFVFDVWGSNANEICATAAQEIAHTWGLDHVKEASDPMTYNTYNGMRTFQDNVTCGSDCVNGSSPFGLSCGTDGQTHTCMATGTNTQMDVQTLLKLFGPSTAKNPTLTLKNPGNYSGQLQGFAIDADCHADDPIQEVVLEVDGVKKMSLTAAPYHFTAPTLSDGLHHITVICGTTQQAIATEQAAVIVGSACVSNTCAAGFLCYDAICIAGPDSPGGLGATCTGDADCRNGATCASDGKESACALPCEVGGDTCPDGYGCQDAGAMGVCWAGADDGGCCDTTGGAGPGAMLLGFGIAAIWFTRKRRR